MKKYDYSEFYQFYQNLEEESKIIVVQKIMSGELDSLLELVDGHEIIFDIYDYGDEFETDDEDFFEEDFSLDQIEDILNIRTKDSPKDTENVIAIINQKDKEIHLNSNSEEEIEKFLYRNLFLKGIFFVKSENQERHKNFKYKYYRRYDFLGQSEQDLCLN